MNTTIALQQTKTLIATAATAMSTEALERNKRWLGRSHGKCPSEISRHLMRTRMYRPVNRTWRMIYRMDKT